MRYSLEMFRTPALDPAIRVHVIRVAGAVYGFIFAAGFATFFWGLDAVQLQHAAVHLAWVKLLLGFSVCLPVCVLAGWLAACARWSALSVLSWMVAAPAVAWLAGHVPYEGLSWVTTLNDPYPAGRAMYPFSPSAAAFIGLSMVIGLGAGFVTGLFQLIVAERAWQHSTASHRLSWRSIAVLCACLPVTLLFGLLADSQINAPLRDALTDVARVVTVALDPAGNLRAAQAPFLETYRAEFTPDYRLDWVQSSADLNTITVDVSFDTGLIMRCQHAQGQISTCLKLSQGLVEWMTQLASWGHLTCVGCPVQIDRAVRRWLTITLPTLGALRQVTFLQHQSGWLYQRATFDSGRAMDCRFRGHRPVRVDLCVEVSP